MDPVTIGLFIALLAALATVAQAYEARRQRLAAQTPRKPQAIPDEAPPEPAVWTCGIYDYPPLSSFPNGPDGPPEGILVSLATAIPDELNQTSRFVYFNYEGFYEGDERLPDLIVGMFDTPDRREVVRFSRAIHEIGLQGICRAELGEDVLAGLRGFAVPGTCLAPRKIPRCLARAWHSAAPGPRGPSKKRAYSRVPQGG